MSERDRYRVHEGVDHILVTDHQATQRPLAWRLNFPEALGNNKAAEPTVVLEALQGSERLGQITIAWNRDGSNLAIRFISQDTYADLELFDVHGPIVAARLDSPTESVNFLLDQSAKTVIGPEPRTDPAVIAELFGHFSEVVHTLHDKDWLEDQFPPAADNVIFKKETGKRAKAIGACNTARKICLTKVGTGTILAGIGAMALLAGPAGWAILAFGLIGAGGGATAAACDNTYRQCIAAAKTQPI